MIGIVGVGPLPTLADDDDVRAVDHRAAGERIRPSEHLDAIDGRRARPFIDGNLAEQAGESLAILVADIHRGTSLQYRVLLVLGYEPWVMTVRNHGY